MQHGYSEAEIEEIARSLIVDYARECEYNTLEKFSINLMDMYNCVIYPCTEIIIDTTQDLGTSNDKMILGLTINSERII